MATGSESFDDFLSSDRLSTMHELKPFKYRDNPKDWDDTHEWLVNNFDNKSKSALSRQIVYRRHHALYKGIHWRYFDSRDANREVEYSDRKPRHVVNFVYEMADARVAQMARFKDNVVVIPAHDDQSDINKAEACKKLLDSRAEEIGLEVIHQEADRIKFIYGHVFQWVLWDKNAGPLNPKYKKIRDKYKGKIPKKIKGKKVNFHNKEVRTGDVCVTNMGPDRMFPEMGKDSWEKVDETEWIEWVHIDELKAEYPDKVDSIHENKRDYYDYELTEITRPENFVMVRHFYHKICHSSPGAPDGAYIKYTDDTILDWEDYPYEDEDGLPFVEDSDISIYGELWGRSFIILIEQLQRFYNNIQSGQARDYGIGNVPKWMMPKGSCSVSSLNNEFVIVEYTGAVKPELVTSHPTNNQGFEVQDRIESKITKLSSVYDISRGDVPAGVTANSALRFLDEQESQRTVVHEIKRKKRVLSVYKMMLKRMKQYYTAQDGRVMRTLGADNEFLFESFKEAIFDGAEDVKLQNSSSLPDTKTGKISTIIDLNTATQTDPVFRKEEIVQMLDLGLDDAFKDGATVGVKAAKTNLQLLRSGKVAPEPQVFDNLLIHYDVFWRGIQSITFKMKTSPNVQKAIIKYVETLEGLMYLKAGKSRAFLEEMLTLPQYPMFFQIPAPLDLLMENFMPPEMGGGMPGGESSPGADTSKVKNLPEQQTNKEK